MDGSREFTEVGGGSRGPVGILAGQVIAMLRARVEQGYAMPKAGECEAFVVELFAASLGDDPEALDAACRRMRRAHLSEDTILGVVLPEAARALGRGWEDDRLSFVQVTMAMSRLQRLVRHLSRSAEGSPVQGEGAVLLLLPSGEQHTLGALVAAEQLRRAGYSVCLTIGPSREEILEVVQAGLFDVAFVSVAVAERLDIVAKVVDTLRTASAGAPVVVGGALLRDKSPAEAEAIKASTGADVATNDLALALRTAGLAPSGRLAATG